MKANESPGINRRTRLFVNPAFILIPFNCTFTQINQREQEENEKKRLEALEWNLHQTRRLLLPFDPFINHRSINVFIWTHHSY